MSFQKFVLHTGKFIAFQSILAGLLVSMYTQSKGNILYSATNIKHERLQVANSPRAIFIGGSNLMFGLESELIKKNTGYEPVNMGLVGGLRLSFMLNEVKSSLKEGDIVVLALEYNQLNSSDQAVVPQVLMGVVEQRPQSLRYLNFTHWRLLLDQGLQEHFGITFRKAISEPRFPFVGKSEVSQSISSQVNQYGDLITFREVAPQHEGNYQEVLPNRISYRVLDERINQLNRFFSYCQERNVKIVFTYPPIPQSQYLKKKEIAEEFHQILQKSLKIPILGAPSDMVFDTDNFINESYHLYGSAIRERTQRLTKALKNNKNSVLGIDEKVIDISHDK